MLQKGGFLIGIGVPGRDNLIEIQGNPSKEGALIKIGALSGNHRIEYKG